MFDLELSQKGKLNVEGSAEQVETHTSSKESPVIQRVKYLARPVASFEVELMQDVRSLCSCLESVHGRVPLSHLAADLASMGYRCSIQCVESPGLGESSNYGNEGDDTRCLELLRHEFILCSGKLDGSSDHQCLVDPNFRDQFLLGKHNKEYETLLDAVPQEFVGSGLRLQALATVICAEMTKVYQELGVSLHLGGGLMQY